MTAASSSAPPRHDRDRPPRPFALICGGGTGGHVLPAIAIGRALVGRGHPAGTIQFLGARRGMEARLVPEAGFRVTLLPGRGVVRKLSLANVKAVAGLAAATWQGEALVARNRPAVIVSLGGYASLPGVVAAATLRVPLVVVEQNAAPGAANRLASRVAVASAVAFAGSGLRHEVVTGNPVRQEVLDVDRRPEARRAARAALGVSEDDVLVLAFGGSLGARRINQAVLELARLWRRRAGVAIYHVVGARDWDEMAATGFEVAPGGLWYRPVRYEDHMEVAYTAADLVVCRAGATSVAELAAAGLPAILVPLPGAPNDHQTANAAAMVNAGAAVLVPDADATGERLATEVELLLDNARRASMAAAATTVAHRDAAEQVAALVERVSRS